MRNVITVPVLLLFAGIAGLAGCRPRAGGAAAPPLPVPSPAAPGGGVVGGVFAGMRDAIAAPRRVFFVIANSDRAVPLACVRNGEVSAGAACLEGVPAGALLSVGGGLEVEVAGRGEAFCEPTRARTPALETPLARVRPRGPVDMRWAVWPPEAADAVTMAKVPGEGLFDEDPAPVSPREQSRIRKAATAVAGRALSPLVLIEQAARIDVDGDGNADQVYGAHVPGMASPKGIDDTPAGVRALFVEQGGALRVVAMADRGTPVLRGTIGLAGGAPALWVGFPAENGDADAILVRETPRPGSHDDGAWTELVRWGCYAPASESRIIR